MAKKAKNIQMDTVILDKVSANGIKLRPAQLFGKRIREVTATEAYRQYVSQKHIENIEKENEDWADAMSSRVYYYR